MFRRLAMVDNSLTYPNVTIFPGDRSGTEYPRMEKLPEGGQRFAISYRLMNGCHACEVVGAAKFVFDFDASGKLLGGKLISIGPPPSGARTAGNDNKSVQQGRKSASAQTLEEQVGQEFVVRLDSNRTTGYRWELAQPLDQTKLVFIATQYEASVSRAVGAGGEEVWKFQAVGKGRASIQMRYVRPWEKDVAPAQTKSYTVVVK